MIKLENVVPASPEQMKKEIAEKIGCSRELVSQKIREEGLR